MSEVQCETEDEAALFCVDLFEEKVKLILNRPELKDQRLPNKLFKFDNTLESSVSV